MEPAAAAGQARAARGKSGLWQMQGGKERKGVSGKKGGVLAVFETGSNEEARRTRSEDLCQSAESLPIESFTD